MPQNAQDIFQKIQGIKKQQKDIRTMVRDAITGSSDFVQVKSEFDALRQKKKEIEIRIKAEFERELSKLDDLSIDLETEIAELSDVVMTRLLQGEIVKVRDAYNNSYDVTVKVGFKKSDEQQ